MILQAYKQPPRIELTHFSIQFKALNCEKHWEESGNKKSSHLLRMGTSSIRLRFRDLILPPTSCRLGAFLTSASRTTSPCVYNYTPQEIVWEKAKLPRKRSQPPIYPRIQFEQLCLHEITESQNTSTVYNFYNELDWRPYWVVFWGEYSPCNRCMDS
jgi:hypothetical protein